MISSELESLATDTMSRSLQTLADQMTSVSASMVELAESSDCLLAKHGLELLGAAMICRELADSIAVADTGNVLPEHNY